MSNKVNISKKIKFIGLKGQKNNMKSNMERMQEKCIKLYAEHKMSILTLEEMPGLSMLMRVHEGHRYNPF